MMGLDMYLMANQYTSKYIRPELRTKLIKVLPPEIKKAEEKNNIGIVNTSVEIGYWRKANQIHGWFVENAQEGNDNCGKYYVSRKQLKKLLGLCKKVLEESKMEKGKITNGQTIDKNGKWIDIKEDGEFIKNPETAEKLLPTKSGCFFGGSDYDEYYTYNLKHTIEIIERCLKLPKEWDIEYNSSW